MQKPGFWPGDLQVSISEGLNDMVVKADIPPQGRDIATVKPISLS
jgi:hypothetical protein